MKFLLLVLFCLSVIKNVAAQIDQKVQYEYRVLYNYAFQPAKENKAFIETEKMLLETGTGHSSFQSYNRYLSDSALKQRIQNAAGQHFFSREGMPERPKIQYIIFKQLEPSQLYMTSTFVVQRPWYKDSLPVFTWQIDENKHKEILGYKCLMATTSFAGRNYTAWYCSTINLPDGPYKFHGLPGLILEIYDIEMQHVFTATTVTKNSRSVELQKWEGKLVQEFKNKEAYDAYVQSLKNDPTLMLKQDLMRIPDDVLEQSAQKIKADIARQNNPLELQP